MTRDHIDVLISGGGVAGLVAAAAFGNAGFSVICVDPNPPVTSRKAAGADLRTTAFLQPSRDVLERAGLWPRLLPHATALETMRIVDVGGANSEPRLTKDFDAQDISDMPFGWNLPNWLLRREILAKIADLPNITFYAGVSTKAVVTRDAEALVSLSSGQKISARLLIGADGRNSMVRQAAGISVHTTRYGQKALAFAVTHPIPHENVSIEIHRSGGPFTLVPLPDYQGKPSSSVVWMERGPEALRLSGLDKAQFETQMTARSAGVLGPLECASQVILWPIISQIANKFCAQRIALIAEAAHVVPPIGAQGLNMSLADLNMLLTLATDHPQSLGGPDMLEEYQHRRWPEAKLRVLGVDLLNKASMAGSYFTKDLRAGALDALHRTPIIRHALMRTGLGMKS